jgi:hypothetical protein
MKISPPTNCDLPFFAYGLFRPDQLGFNQIADLVDRKEPASIRGQLYIRDGLPILVLDERGENFVRGFVIYFTDSRSAYERIVAIEPGSQYLWSETAVSVDNANVLIGRSPQKGSELAQGDWDGAHDPLFTTALDVVKEVLRTHSGFKDDLKPMFYLEMAYLLLWSSIERFLSLKYYLGGDVRKKIRFLASEHAFKDALRTLAPAPRSVYCSDDPKNRVTLSSNPLKAVNYYYQIRCNLTHSGKGVQKDHERVLCALRELSQLFDAVLGSSFGRR